ncbi:hypothetical protein [Kiloniella sp. b19]|uniref:hypothetical protein n=1 Tax=Kiloniella sp. GXU_MW_B19 TaxID=3141326 RepID=UPI0031DD1B81
MYDNNLGLESLQDNGVLVAPDLNLEDADSAVLSGAVVRISQNFAGDQDVLSWDGSVLPAGVTASYGVATGMLSMSGLTSFAEYQTLINSVRYSNSSDAPSEAQRSVTFQVTDDQGEISNDVVKVVDVFGMVDSNVFGDDGNNSLTATDAKGVGLIRLSR